MAKEVVLESLFIIVIEDIRANGNVISRMGEGISNFRMDASIRVTMLMGNRKDLENINGPMENIMKENGLMGSNMDLVLGWESKETNMLGNGNLGRQMEKEFMFGLMEIGIKGSLSNV